MAKATVEGSNSVIEGADVFFKAKVSNDDLIEWEKSGANIHFDIHDFRVIEDEVLEQLGRKTIRAYDKVLGAYEVLNVKPKHDVEMGTPYDIGISLRHRVKHSPGFHHTLVRPDDVDQFKDNGYIFVRNAEERNGKVTLVEMKVNEANYRATLKRDALKSAEMLKGVKTQFNDRVRDNKKDVRLLADDSED